MTAPSSLKHLLHHWTGFRPIERGFEPRMTRRAATKVEQMLGDSPPRRPKPYDLHALHHRVMKAWRRDRSLARLVLRDMRRLPWILFYPAAKTGTESTNWLGAEPAVVEEYGLWLSAGRRSRSVLALLHEFLRVYPIDLLTFDELRRLLHDATKDGLSRRRPSLRRWQERCQNYRILEPKGAETFVQKLLSASGTPEDILRQAGLDTGLARCRFLKSGVRMYLPRVESLLNDNRLDEGQLDRLLTLLACDNKLRFEDRMARLEVATALLRPFSERRPEPATREHLQPFFLRHFGDPRLQSGKHRWSGIPSETRQVVIRWLNERALERFFQLVKETALDRHWRYREAFWRAFLPLDPDIWFVLGRLAGLHLRRVNWESDEHESTATLRDAQGDQSALLLRLPGVTVAEWSHNGACRFWLDGTGSAPKLYKREYSRRELTKETNFRQVHYGSAGGLWQRQIMAWLRENTGIEISRAEYFPARLHERQ